MSSLTTFMSAFEQIAVGTGRGSFVEVFFHSNRRSKNDGRSRMSRTDRLTQVYAGSVRQPVVQHIKVERLVIDQGVSILKFIGKYEIVFAQKYLKYFASVKVILDTQDPL